MGEKWWWQVGKKDTQGRRRRSQQIKNVIRVWNQRNGRKKMDGMGVDVTGMEGLAGDGIERKSGESDEEELEVY
jgi:hypothetical protein